MKKSSRPVLSLRTETIALLTAAQLAAIAGGQFNNKASMVISYCITVCPGDGSNA
jgi:hypothetical protein